MNTQQTKSFSAGWENAYQSHVIENSEPDLIWDDRPHAFLEEIGLIAKLKSRRVHTVIDAGCGDGRNSFFLEQNGFFTMGADISKSALNLARQRAEAGSHTKLIFCEEDLCSMKIAGPVDAILCADCLGQIQNTSQVISEFHRLLVPGGLLVTNLYDFEDDTFGVGEAHPSLANSFIYKETLFRFFSSDDIAALFPSHLWGVVEVRKTVWFDPPHGTFRPNPHQHSSFVILAEKKILEV